MYQLDTEEMTDTCRLTDMNAEIEIGSLFESFSALDEIKKWHFKLVQFSTRDSREVQK